MTQERFEKFRNKMIKSVDNLRAKDWNTPDMVDMIIIHYLEYLGEKE